MIIVDSFLNCNNPQIKTKIRLSEIYSRISVELVFWYQAHPFHVLLSLVKFTHAHIFWHYVTYVSYLSNCFTLLSLFRPLLFSVLLQFHRPLNQNSFMSWHFTNIILYLSFKSISSKGCFIQSSSGIIQNHLLSISAFQTLYRLMPHWLM